MSRGVFIVGTDTGCGKTTVAVGLTAALARRGMRVAAMKPCETGGGDDATRLGAASGRQTDPSLLNPYRFALAAAPQIAANREGRRVDFNAISHAQQTLARDSDLVIVEGAGGLLVPIVDGLTMADLAAHLQLPLLVVARTRLGTINHTLLTIEAIRRRDLRLVGVIFSRDQRHVGAEEDDSIAALLRLSDLPSFGVVPYLPKASQRDALKLATAIESHVRVDDLLTALGPGQPAHESL